jgi:4-carboxymuconolactone decarboxylase
MNQPTRFTLLQLTQMAGLPARRSIRLTATLIVAAWAALPVSAAFAASPEASTPRLTMPAPAELSAEQREAMAAFEAARKTPVFGPFEPLLNSPQLMTAARAMGDHLRYHAAIGPALSEWAILITARAWTQDYEWALHLPLAIKAGVDPRAAQALAEGRRPEGLGPDQQLVYDYLDELNRTHQVSDATFARALARFGRQGVVDLTGVHGYYTFLAMTLNVARTPVPPGGATLPRLP